jgi:hypothetical protein
MILSKETSTRNNKGATLLTQRFERYFNALR